MRIASYNILSGGFKTYSFELSSPKRLDLLKKAVKSINADLIGLVDTFRWDSLYTIEQLSELFSYTNVYCINLNDSRLKEKGHNNGITVLTNLPVKKFETISLTTRDAIKATIEMDNDEVDVFSVYLDDLSEDTRLTQVDALLKNIKIDKPTVIMGDLNTLSLKDLSKTDLLINEFAKVNPQMYKAMKPVLDQMKRGEVIKQFETFGLKDADKDGMPTAPTKLFPAEIKGAVLRLDYALYTDRLKVQNFNVLTGPNFDKSSDHYPISFEVEINT